MFIVALTGGIGSGKSLAAEYFARLGAAVLDADQLSREAIKRGSPGFDQVVAAFGDGILRDGDIDRHVLGERVFGNVSERKKLEAIVHPLVREAFDSAISHLQNHDLLIYEIPLLVETNAVSRFDYVITVEAAAELRRERLKDRGMLSVNVEARMTAQASSQQRIASADYVLWNDGTADELLRKVEHLWESVLPSINRAES
jgi:dephospho-CoA kinase